jgi:hypothetical protein
MVFVTLVFGPWGVGSKTLCRGNINKRVLPPILSVSEWMPIPAPRSGRDIYMERRWYGLSLPNPLQSFELTQGTVEVAIESCTISQ